MLFFYENNFPFILRDNGGNSGGYSLSSSNEPSGTRIEQNVETEPELRRSKKDRTLKYFGLDFYVFTMIEDPNSLKESLTSPDADLWQEAINDEMDSLESNKTWHLVDLPPGCKTIECKWFLKRKLKPDGSIEKYKACLVAKGFKQKENIDFFDTYSPVTRVTAIRVLIALAAIHY